MAQNDPIDVLRGVMPSWLKPSASVDLLLILCGVRYSMRTEICERAAEPGIRKWARSLGLYANSDIDMFATFSRHPGVGRRLLHLDRSPRKHTRELGQMLGYPACCCRMAARVGESTIDEFANLVCGQRFIGRFRLIDPSGYGQGRSLISHVPCSSSCLDSLQIASHAARALSGRKGLISAFQR